MQFEVAGETHHPSPGEELFILAGVMHSAWNIGQSASAGAISLAKRASRLLPMP